MNADATPAGSMKLTVTFTNWNQKFTVQTRGPVDEVGNSIDLTNKLVTAWVLARSGISSYPYFSSGVELFIKTGNQFVWGRSQWTNISDLDVWIPVVFDTNNPEGVPQGSTFDPSRPGYVGLQIDTGGAGEGGYCVQDYAVAFGAPRTLVLYVDNFEYQDRP